MPKIVIIGAGIVGCSLADELTERGYCDIVVIEKGKLWKPGGSTSHAPGVVFQTNGSRTMAQFARQTVEKLHGLREGDETCFLKVGSLEIATTPERLAELHRRAGLAQSVGINAYVVSPEAALKLHPLLVRDKLLGALYVADDGIARAILADKLMGERSISRGAQFIADCEVLAIDQSDGRVTGVQTTKGIFPADIVVSCAGIWGPKIGAMVFSRWRTSFAIQCQCLNWLLTRVKLNCLCYVTRVLIFISDREDRVLRLAGTDIGRFL